VSGSKIRILALTLDPELSILADGEYVVRCKFPDYYTMLYRRRSSFHYGDLWVARLVYRTPVIRGAGLPRD
jgi:hypothetical protein